jgi:hypothetical protein
MFVVALPRSPICSSESRTGASNTLRGSLQAVDGKAVVRMEDRFSTDIDDLWPALTDPQRLARWIAAVEGDLRLGGEFRASFTSGWEGPGRPADWRTRWTELTPAYQDQQRRL